MARILMILDHAFPPDIRVENEARTLVSAGHDVRVLSIGPDASVASDPPEGVGVYRDRLPATVRNKMRGLAGSLPFLDLYVSRRMSRIYGNWPFDAVHAHDLYLVGGALRGARRLGVRVVADLHENWVAALGGYAWSNRWPAKMVVRLERWDRLETEWAIASDAVIAVIEEMADRLSAKGVPAESIHVVPNTVHADSFNAFRMDPTIVESIRSPLTLLYTGGMDRHRGLDTAIRAMPDILERQPGARLVLVGDGVVRSELESLADSISVSHAVRFEGFRPQSLIRSYIEGSHVGLIPHVKTEHTDHTIPHKLFHYMLSARAVVASDCRPIARILTETSSGLVYRSEDARELADRVMELDRDREQMDRLGRNGREAVRNRYNWDATASALVRLYDELFAGA